MANISFTVALVSGTSSLTCRGGFFSASSLSPLSPCWWARCGCRSLRDGLSSKTATKRPWLSSRKCMAISEIKHFICGNTIKSDPKSTWTNGSASAYDPYFQRSPIARDSLLLWELHYFSSKNDPSFLCVIFRWFLTSEFSRLTGVIPIQNYQVTIYQSLGFSNLLSLVLTGVYGTVATTSAVIAMLLCDRIGRRKLVVCS